MSLLNKHIFISKDPSQVSALKNVIEEEKGKLTARAFIRFEKIPVTDVPTADIVFFSSPRSVQYFLEDHKIPNDTLIACVGGSTHNELKRHGITANFVGADDRSIDEVANDFKIFAADARVLFPVSTLSIGTIASKIDQDKRCVIEVYRTILDSESMDAFDIYVFTSPSNVRSFLLKNDIPSGAEVIAWGNSTEKELSTREIKCKKLGTPSLECLIDLLSDS